MEEDFEYFIQVLSVKCGMKYWGCTKRRYFNPFSKRVNMVFLRACHSLDLPLLRYLGGYIAASVTFQNI